MLRTIASMLCVTVAAAAVYFYRSRTFPPSETTGATLSHVARLYKYWLLGFGMVWVTLMFVVEVFSPLRWQDIVMSVSLLTVLSVNCISCRICEKGFVEAGEGFIPWTAVAMVAKEPNGNVLLILKEDFARRGSRTLKIGKCDPAIINERIAPVKHT